MAGEKANNRIYIWLTVVLGIATVVVAVKTLFGSMKKANAERDKYFALLDKYAHGMIHYISTARDTGWKDAIAVGACKHGVTFEQSAVRSLAYMIRTSEGKVEIDGVEYKIPLDILIAWRDSRNGKSPYWGTDQWDPNCDTSKLKLSAEDRANIKFGGSGWATGRGNTGKNTGN